MAITCPTSRRLLTLVLAPLVLGLGVGFTFQDAHVAMPLVVQPGTRVHTGTSCEVRDHIQSLTQGLEFKEADSAMRRDCGCVRRAAKTIRPGSRVSDLGIYTNDQCWCVRNWAAVSLAVNVKVASEALPLGKVEGQVNSADQLGFGEHTRTFVLNELELRSITLR